MLGQGRGRWAIAQILILIPKAFIWCEYLLRHFLAYMICSEKRIVVVSFDVQIMAKIN